MVRAINRRLLISAARVRSQASLCGICGGQNDIKRGFSPRASDFPL
jgi:hypothetical protein